MRQNVEIKRQIKRNVKTSRDECMIDLAFDIIDKTIAIIDHWVFIFRQIFAHERS